MKVALLAASAATMALFLSGAPASGFDCGKASTKTELAICADPALKATDDAMSAAEAAVDVAQVLRLHTIVEVSGGTASASYWRCMCGETGSIMGGVRPTAAAAGRMHVALAIVSALATHDGAT